MLRKILSIFSIILFCVLFTSGCGSNNINVEENELVKKFNKVEIGMEKSEVDSILNVSDPINGKYENGNITISFVNEKVSTVDLQLSFNLEEIRNPNTNLSKMNSFINKLNKGEKIYYDELRNEFKTDGICLSKVSNGCNIYGWSNDKGQYAEVYLNVYSDGYVTVIHGKA